ncbi:MAG: hypothetical protein JXR46_06055 [Calditrichaceae bacterium]|nr:hypothetical protein [Calditrichaceae bacterium]MBN2708589.1 hypothetical protein [Calditrichaceae bacterium]
MKNASKLIVIILFLISLPLYAQDIQEVYEEAKSALLDGNYESAQLKVSMAYAMIDDDQNIDPNGTFKKKLLPKIEQTANDMAVIVKALEELNLQSQEQLTFPDLPASRESVSLYTQLAQNAGSDMLHKRDSILAMHEIDAEYREALRKNQVYKEMDHFISQGIVEKLSEKFVSIAGVLTDSLNQLNENYKSVSANIEKMKKSYASNRVQRQKLEKELERISQERMNYINALSEMLAGETSPENPELRNQLTQNNVEGIFSDVIRSEIEHIQSLSEVDSVTYRELMKNYDRIKKYNQIFLKNNISADQSELLARYEQAIQSVKIQQPSETNTVLIVIIIAVALILIVLLLLLIKPKDKRVPGTPIPSEPSEQNKPKE